MQVIVCDACGKICKPIKQSDYAVKKVDGVNQLKTDLCDDCYAKILEVMNAISKTEVSSGNSESEG